MSVWVIGTDELALSHFVISPLAETVGALSVLSRRRPEPMQHDWYLRHRAAYRDRVASDPEARELVAAAVRPRWIADFIAAPPCPGDRSIHDELRRVRRTPPSAAHRDLLTGFGASSHLPEDLGAVNPAHILVEVLEWVWATTIRPDWPQRRQLLEADIVTRTRQLTIGGWAAALGGLRPGLRWLGDGRLQINDNTTPPRDLTGARLVYVPVTVGRGWVGWDPPARYSIVYRASGLQADTTSEPSRTPASEALGRLMGQGRATVLSLLDDPRSTSQLVAVSGYSLGTVGGHLAVLLDAGFVHRRRTGRTVLYYRSRLGDSAVRRTRTPVESNPRRHADRIR